MAAPELVARFEDLRDGAPGAALDFESVAAGARALEDVTGSLSSLKAMRDLTHRYPAVPVVDEAVFHLPERLGAMAGEPLPAEVARQGITQTDLRLMAAAWDREFLALSPDSPHVPEAGFHLVQGLLRLRAWVQAAEWSERLATAHPDSALLDSLLYMRAVALSEQGQDARARALLQSVISGEFPQEDGSQGPAVMATDARYAAARLDEASGRLAEARAGYEIVASDFPEARRALDAMDRVTLSVTPVVRLESGEAAELDIVATNVETAHVRAYRLDLRTVFLRDRGLQQVHDVQVAGVSPTWSGSRPVRAGSFPREAKIVLPLQGAGAWLVEVDGNGQQARSLVVRSSLSLDTTDADGLRRVVVRHRDGTPAAAAEVRAIAGEVVASRTDLRGVVLVPQGAPVLVWAGDDTAFTESEPDEGVRYGGAYDQGSMDIEGDLLRNVDSRLMEQRTRNEAGYEATFQKSRRVNVEAAAM